MYIIYAGDIPESIGKLDKLETLDLSGLKITSTY